KMADPTGNATTFTYDANFNLTTVTAADGAAFTMHYNHLTYANYITSVTTSYGASVSFTYGGTDPNGNSYGDYFLTGITDAAGIFSQVFYGTVASLSSFVSLLITPYGTTHFSTVGDSGSNGVFDRTVRITRQDGTQEFYGMMNQY